MKNVGVLKKYRYTNIGQKTDNGSFETDKYYTRGTELVSVDIADGGNNGYNRYICKHGFVCRNA